MSKPLIMLINDHLEDSSSIARDLAHFEIEIFSDIQYGLNFFQENHTYIRLILISTEIKDFNFKQITDDFKLLNPSVQIIILSRQFNTKDIIEYMKQGIYDFIDLNSGLDAVKISVNNLLEKSYVIDSSENHFGITQQNSEQMLLNTLTLLDMLLLEDFNSVDDVQEISKNYSNWKKTELDQVDVPSILIVEDEPECNDMFYEFLSGDFNVYSVFDGESCRDILKTESFDIILLDLFLPDMAVSDLVQDFFNSNPSTKIIVITAFDFSREVIDVMRAGASDLLHKPVLKEEAEKKEVKTKTEKKETPKKTAKVEKEVKVEKEKTPKKETKTEKKETPKKTVKAEKEVKEKKETVKKAKKTDEPKKSKTEKK